ncbi:MAG TPA: hypothetical protein DEF30_05875 [Proteiniclasticum sp.]|uniref:alcohol dehydrogenase catalytic domain-containing protein n=1 Tax=Proteiniclasticum sp. TaxID=2053595 RepID=UPI000E976ACF|nr:alcohol dehydrogenase catalytic domain-containing protein [Proteiniclasticum sp.]HBW13329.1 hypothetical protein [Proteiniclasticum sp.]
MLSKGFKVVQPRRFEVYIEDLDFNEGRTLVKIDTAAICKADLRYYIGKRDARVLGLKYPMNLIHEAVGTVVKDKSGRFSVGDRVVLVPNYIPDTHNSSECKVCQNSYLGENYCPSALFASSNFNGFSRDYIVWPAKNLVKFDNSISFNHAVFAELTSVANAAYRRIDSREDDVIAVWGDGILGYILVAVLKQFHNGDIIVIGHNEEKLSKFEGVRTFLSDDPRIRDCSITVGFECIGGAPSEKGIEEIINVIQPGGRIVLTGVAEDYVKIDTRRVLEKGLSLYGITRSSVKDFEVAVQLLKKADFISDISKLVLEVDIIKNIIDYYETFEKESTNRKLGKFVMKFQF